MANYNDNVVCDRIGMLNFDIDAAAEGPQSQFRVVAQKRIVGSVMTLGAYNPGKLTEGWRRASVFRIMTWMNTLQKTKSQFFRISI